MENKTLKADGSWDWEADGFSPIPDGHTLHPDHVASIAAGNERYNAGAGKTPQQNFNEASATMLTLGPQMALATWIAMLDSMK